MFKRKNLFDKEISLPLFDPEEEVSQNASKKDYEHNQQNRFYKEQQGENASLSHVFDRDNSTANHSNKQNYQFNQEQSSDSEIPDITRRSVLLASEEPETTLGQGVSFSGKLEFQRLLRIDGIFEGELTSDGKLVVGATGVVKSNIDLNEAVIEGVVDGNINVKERLELRGEAQIRGDIKAGVLSIDEGVSILGHVNVTPNDTKGLFSSMRGESKSKKRKVKT